MVEVFFASIVFLWTGYWLGVIRERKARGVPGRPREVYERVLTCTRCGTLVAVFEAQTGATSHHGHRFLNPTSYVCAACEETT